MLQQVIITFKLSIVTGWKPGAKPVKNPLQLAEFMYIT